MVVNMSWLVTRTRAFNVCLYNTVVQLNVKPRLLAYMTHKCYGGSRLPNEKFRIFFLIFHKKCLQCHENVFKKKPLAEGSFLCRAVSQAYEVWDETCICNS